MLMILMFYLMVLIVIATTLLAYYNENKMWKYIAIACWIVFALIIVVH